MNFLNILIGIIIGALLMIPLFWIQRKWLRLLLIIVAVACAATTVQLSNLYLYPTYIGWQFERGILKQPLFQIIAEHHPREFKEYINKIKQNLKKGNTQLIPIYSSQLVNQIFFAHLEHAPNENVSLYLRATINLYQYLYTQDPRAVIKLENNEAVDFDFKNLLQDREFQALLNHLLDTKRFLIEGAIQTPQPVPTEAQGDPLLQGVLDRLAKKYGEEALKVMFSPGAAQIPANMQAQFFIEFYSEILATGKEKAGTIMRFIGSLKTKSLTAQPVAEEEQTAKQSKKE